MPFYISYRVEKNLLGSNKKYPTRPLRRYDNEHREVTGDMKVETYDSMMYCLVASLLPLAVGTGVVRSHDQFEGICDDLK